MITFRGLRILAPAGPVAWRAMEAPLPVVRHLLRDHAQIRLARRRLARKMRCFRVERPRHGCDLRRRSNRSNAPADPAALGTVNNSLTAAWQISSGVSATGDGAMDSLPAWALWPITIAVGVSPGLAVLSAGAIGRFLSRMLGPPPEVAPRPGREAARELGRSCRSARVKRWPEAVEALVFWWYEKHTCRARPRSGRPDGETGDVIRGLGLDRSGTHLTARLA